MDGRLQTRDVRVAAIAGTIPTHALDRLPAGMTSKAVNKRGDHRLGVVRRAMGLLDRLDHDVSRTRDRTMPPAAEEESKDVFSRWSMTPSADPIEHGLLYKDLAKSTLVRLNRRQDVMGVSERLPQDGVHDRHRLPPDAIAGL